MCERVLCRQLPRVILRVSRPSRSPYPGMPHTPAWYASQYRSRLRVTTALEAPEVPWAMVAHVDSSMGVAVFHHWPSGHPPLGPLPPVSVSMDKRQNLLLIKTFRLSLHAHGEPGLNVKFRPSSLTTSTSTHSMASRPLRCGGIFWSWGCMARWSRPARVPSRFERLGLFEVRLHML